MKHTTQNHFDILFSRFPALEACRKPILAAFEALLSCFQKGGKLLLCGNGGSAADCDHIAGELQKGFLLKREPGEDFVSGFDALFPGNGVARKLQRGLPALSLCAHTALLTAFTNDVDAKLVYAQALYALAAEGDVLLAISTGGNAENVINAAMTAKVLGLTVIGLTGAGGGRLAPLCNVVVKVPESETFKIQELHLPVYHALCAAVEEEIFG